MHRQTEKLRHRARAGNLKGLRDRGKRIHTQKEREAHKHTHMDSNWCRCGGRDRYRDWDSRQGRKREMERTSALFLASTVSALHRNAHIWNASHPLLVTYYCRVTVYSPSMEAKKLTLEIRVSFPEFEPRTLSTKTHASTDWASQTVVNNGSYVV